MGYYKPDTWLGTGTGSSVQIFSGAFKIEQMSKEKILYEGKTMKITDVKLRFAKHYLFVQIYTDAGITGLGEAAGNWGYLQATAAIEKFADYLIGKRSVPY